MITCNFNSEKICCFQGIKSGHKLGFLFKICKISLPTKSHSLNVALRVSKTLSLTKVWSEAISVWKEDLSGYKIYLRHKCDIYAELEIRRKKIITTLWSLFSALFYKCIFYQFIFFWSLRRLLSPNQLMPSLKQFCAIDGTPPPLHHQFSRQATKTSKLWTIYQALSTPISWKFEIRFYWNHFNEMILVLHMIGSVLPFLSSEIPSIPIYLYSIFWRVWISRNNGQKHQ